MPTRALNRTAPPSVEDATHAATPIPGQRLGRYELLMLLAVGGMAQVWLARQSGDHGFSKLVAVKVIRPDIASDRAFREMFLDEARVTARIRHANVVEVLDLGEVDGLVFQAMTFIDGAALSTLLARRRGRPLPLHVGLSIVMDLLRGLHAAHELRDDAGMPLGLVHRDVSPQNLLIGTDGVAKLSDFGIARTSTPRTAETMAGEIKGKLRYMAPEQLAAQTPTRQSDIFAAGVVLWEVLTGQALFPTMTLVEARSNRGAVRDPRGCAPDVPAPIAEVTLRALADRPVDRFATAQEMAEALDAAASQSGIVLRHSAVAELVTDVLGTDLQRRKLLVRAAEGATVAELQTTATVLMTTEPGQPEGRRFRWLPLVLVAITCLVGTTAVLLYVDGHRHVSPAMMSPPASAQAPPIAPDVTTSTPPVPMTTAATPEPPLASASASTSAHPSTPIKKPKPAPLPAVSQPRPAFDNPYQ